MLSHFAYRKLPIIVHELPTTESVTILILVKAGSRYENKHTSGTAHFLEHMFFKGGKTYTTAKDVARAIDSIGGQHNAFTDKDIAGYYVKLAKEHVETGMKVLSDMLLHATIPEEELEKERGVIIEELKMYRDMPSSEVGRIFDEMIYGNHPLGWDIGGSEESVKKLQKKDLSSMRDALYFAENMVISVAGNISEKEVAHLVEQYFHVPSQQTTPAYEPFHHVSTTTNVRIETKDTDQSHIVYGMYGVQRSHPLYIASKVCATLLGGPSSSRLFQTMREEKGICYYVYASSESFDDTGCFSFRSGVANARIHEALEVLQHEYILLLEKGVTKEEVQFAKEYMKGSMALQMEDSEALAYFHGAQHILFGKNISVEERKQQINSVTRDDIHDFLQVLSAQQKYLAIVGPSSHIEEFQIYVTPKV